MNKTRIAAHTLYAGLVPVLGETVGMPDHTRLSELVSLADLRSIKLGDIRLLAGVLADVISEGKTENV